MDTSFWDNLKIPYQTEDGSFQYANPVIVSQYFLRAPGLLAELSQRAEVLTEEIATYKFKRDESERKLNDLRRRLLAKNFRKLTKSAGTEVRDAYVYKCALEEGEECFNELNTLEEQIATYDKEVARREPRLVQLKARAKDLIQAMEWAREYLNYEKHVTRLDR